MNEFTERKTKLGRGLAELFGEDVGGGLTELAVTNLIPGPSQPRKIFDKEKIRQLAESIQDSGVLQPILVRPRHGSPGHYEIVAGERRWLASQEAGLRVVPVIIRDLSDVEAAKIAIIENVQREDLNVLEEAEGYQRLITDYGYTQEKIAADIGKSRSHVANTLRLLALPEDVKGFVASGQLTAGHARALLNADNAAEVANSIIANKMNVRDAEKITRRKAPSATSPDMVYLATQLETMLDMPVTLTSNGEKITATLEFASLAKLDAFVDYTMRLGPLSSH